MSLAVAKSQRAPSRKGPPTMLPIERKSSCTSLRAAYRNGIAMTNKITAESTALLGQIIQNEPDTGSPFRCSKYEPFPAAKHNPSRPNLPGGPTLGRDYFSRSDRGDAGPREGMLPRWAGKRGYTFLALPWKIFSLSSLLSPLTAST